MSKRAFQRHGPDSSLAGLDNTYNHSSSLPLPGGSKGSHTEESSSSAAGSDLVHLSTEGSRQHSPFEDLPHPDRFEEGGNSGLAKGKEAVEEEDDSDFDNWDEDLEANEAGDGDEMPSDLRPSMHGRAGSHQNAPLLGGGGDKNGEYQQHRSPSARTSRSRLRERDPEEMAKAATRQRYTLAAGFLLISLVSFAVQTETAVYIQHNLGWKKAYCML